MPDNDPIDIWEIAETLQQELEDELGLPHSRGPIDLDIEEKLLKFATWQDFAKANLAAMQPIISVEGFLNDFGMTGLFK